MAYSDMRSWRLATGGLLGCVLASWLLSGPVASAADFAALRSAADAGDLAAARDLGSALLWGSEELDQDTEAAITLLSRAAEAGDAKAQLILGQAYLWGVPVPKDLAEADRLLSAAATQGNVDAQRVLGQNLIGGWGFERDVERGLPMLEAAAATNDARAQVALGKFYLYGKPLGKDRAKALSLFEAAAQSGNGEGLAAYGEDVMWGERGWKEAQAYLERAGMLGDSRAWSILAEGAMWGYLGPESRGKFDGYADRARAAGETRIAVLESKRSTWGISMRASGPKTLATLGEAADQGNLDALRELISLQRDGNHYNIRKDPAGARAVLDAHLEMLSETEQAQFLQSIEVATHKMTRDFPRLSREIRAMPGGVTKAFATELHKANPNMAFYMLQEDMKASGLYRGKLDGLAGPMTLKGVKKLCDALPDEENCGDRVLDRDLIAKLLAR
ncbi:tetratricopeptide repeat protein [Celeribacter neptunius]|uniref:TPR repeat n=1 Tax=Celeribacter neptunius TaxID=588602 RepID=A0A1I3LQ80_9RHOB|nr:tetratricopeptide repeat protein [Celeribacter neptunius]SFI86665.1 TPR repeat [Celeribacter neptunius]